MVWLALLFFGIAFLLMMSNEKSNKKEGVIIRDALAKYIGGFSDIQGGKSAHIKVKKDGIEILFGGVTIQDQKYIPMDLIINAEIKSESQISKEVTLGRMLVFGALAFAMKKEKNNIENYLVINCKKDDQEVSLIFKSNLAELIVKNIRQLKNIKSVF